MDIILDTNVYRSDLQLRSKDFAIICDYLERTNSDLIIPRIVLEEIMGLYKRTILERLEHFRNASSKLTSTFVDGQPDIAVPDIDPNIETNKYEQYLFSRFKINKKQIFGYKANYLDEVVSRAVERKKPCGSDGQNFRDTILWLSVLDYAKTTPDKKVIFISNNPKDFSAKESQALHPQLLEDCANNGVEIQYYNSLRGFIQGHAAKIDFITEEWLVENLNIDRIEADFLKILEVQANSELIKLFEKKHDDKKPTGHANPVAFSSFNLVSFHVYEMADETMIVTATFSGEMEIEFEYEKSIEEDLTSYEYEYKINPATGDLDHDMVFKPKLKQERGYAYSYEYPDLEMTLKATIRARKVVELEISDWVIL